MEPSTPADETLERGQRCSNPTTDLRQRLREILAQAPAISVERLNELRRIAGSRWRT